MSNKESSDVGHAADEHAEANAACDLVPMTWIATARASWMFSCTIASLPHGHRQLNRLRCHLALHSPNNMQRKLVTAEELDRFLRRTADFHSAVMTHLGELVPYEEQRFVVAFQSGLLAVEHATGALSLNLQGFHTSACALMRPQFEAHLRGVWLMYAAKDGWVRKLSEPLTEDSARRSNSIPMPAAMFEDLRRCSEAPQPVIQQLEEYSEVTWKALSSYTHGGLHPLSKVASGFPAQLVFDVQRNSNAMLALSTQLLSILTGDPSAMAPVRRLHVEFADCLPIIHPPPTANPPY